MSSVISAATWLGAPSSIFWETAAIIVLTIALIAIGILTLRTSAARKSLNFSIISRTRLLDAPESMRGRLQVVFGNERPLADPYVTVVEIANTGKNSIASSLFDNNRAMIFNLGADVVEVLSVARTPESSPLPNIVSSGSTIELHREVIAAGEVIRASVLTQDRVRGIELTLNPLNESYKISTRDREVWQRQQVRRLKFVTAAMGVLAGIEIVTLFFFLSNSLSNTTAALDSSNSAMKTNVCEGVDEASLNLGGMATIQTENLMAMFNAHSTRLAKFNGGFANNTRYLNVQIGVFGSNTADAAALGINMKESSPTVQEANRLLAVFTGLTKSKTVAQQKADLLQAENLSLSVLQDVGNVMHNCRPYLPAP
jgi:hypothetical protein